jgi:hypothetical protein
MMMPKAASNLNYLFSIAKHQIRLTWKVAGMKAVAIAHPMHHPADNKFWLHSLASYAAHIFAASRCRDIVHRKAS